MPAFRIDTGLGSVMPPSVLPKPVMPAIAEKVVVLPRQC